MSGSNNKANYTRGVLVGNWSEDLAGQQLAARSSQPAAPRESGTRADFTRPPKEAYLNRAQPVGTRDGGSINLSMRGAPEGEDRWQTEAAAAQGRVKPQVGLNRRRNKKMAQDRAVRA